MSYPQRPTDPHHTREPRNGFGITALVLALVGAVFGIVPLTGLVALICGVLAVLFGLLGLGRVRRGAATNGKMAGISTGLGVLASALGIWGITIVFGAVDQLGRDLDAVTGNDPAAVQDVTVTGCTAREDYGVTQAQAVVSVTNSTGTPASYRCDDRSR